MVHRARAASRRVCVERCRSIDPARTVERNRHAVHFHARRLPPALAIFVFGPGYLRHALPHYLSSRAAGKRGAYTIDVNRGTRRFPRGADATITASLRVDADQPRCDPKSPTPLRTSAAFAATVVRGDSVRDLAGPVDYSSSLRRPVSGTSRSGLDLPYVGRLELGSLPRLPA